MAVQFCGTCGRPLIPDQLFCQHCGSRVDENATRSAPPVTPGITVAPATSAGTLYCGECGALVGSQDRTCRRCGAPVEPATGGVSDPSLSDLPTMMGTPPGAFQAQPAPQAPSMIQNQPAYQPPSAPRGPQTPTPDYQNQPPSPWGASYTPSPYNDSPTFTFGGQRPAVQAPPYQPGGPDGPPPRSGSRWPIVLALVLVALALIAGGGIFLVLAHPGTTANTGGGTPTTRPGITPTTVTPTATPNPSPTAVVLDTDTASQLVTQFYNDINAKQYNDAYNLLSPEWQQTQSRQNFVDGYQDTVMDTLTINNAQQLTDGTVQVNVQLVAQNTNGTVTYAGYYIVTIENGQLLLLKGDLNPQ